MKLLAKYSDLNEAKEVSLQLREKGVLTYLSSVNSYRLSRVRTGALKVGLWVVLEKQFQDAKRLLSNPNHKPMYRLSESEMAEIETKASNAYGAMSQNLINTALAWLSAITLVALIGYLLYAVIYSA